jgi:hypothetical protein
MRRDEQQALREQKKHLMAELRSIGARHRESGAWAPEDRDRFEYCTSQVSTINDTLEVEHKRELEEIRAGSGNGSTSEFRAGFERSHAPEPLYEAFRSAGFARGKPAE